MQMISRDETGGGDQKSREEENRMDVCEVVNVVSARGFKPKGFAATVCSGPRNGSGFLDRDFSFESDYSSI